MNTTTRSGTPTGVVVASTAEDAAAVEAVQQHHAELAGRLAAHAEHLLKAAGTSDRAAFEQRARPRRPSASTSCCRTPPPRRTGCTRRPRHPRPRGCWWNP